jgi:hypothetical protein
VRINRAELAALTTADLVGMIQYMGSMAEDEDKNPDIHNIGVKFKILVGELNNRIGRVFPPVHKTADGEIEHL